MEKLSKSTFTSILQSMFGLLIISLAILNAPALVNVSANPGKPIDPPAKNGQLHSPVHQLVIPSRQELTKQEVQNVAQKYMQALLDQQQNVMWSLLHPQIQSKWPNETAFATFLQNRFKEYTLQGFKLGNVQKLSYWVDTETMISYTQLEEIPVSLLLTPRIAPSQTLLFLPKIFTLISSFKIFQSLCNIVVIKTAKAGIGLFLMGVPLISKRPSSHL